MPFAPQTPSRPAIPLLLSRLLGLLLRPLYWAALRWLPEGDAWEVFRMPVSFDRFGAGSRHRFDWYHEGESGVRCESVEDVVAWLRGCEYEDDGELFREADFWQHPVTFERLRRGDCEDFALWAWRKLNELGVPARLFVGKVLKDGRASHDGHAWVVFEDGGQEMLLEPASREDDATVRPLSAVRHEYRPHYSVDAEGRTASYGGLLTSLREDRALRRTKDAGIVRARVGAVAGDAVP